jgi:hypothetical protein
MFIVWGKKIVYRRLGHVAEFCPICREAKPMRLRRIGLAGHVYYITAGEGELRGYDLTCLDCKTAYEGKPNQYASVSPKLLALAELKRATYPDMETALHDRLALEERVRRAPALLSADERDALVRSPFLLLSPEVEQRFAQTNCDKEVAFALIAAVVMMAAAPALSAAILPDQPELLMLAAFVAGVVLVIWQFVLSSQRFMRRAIIPRLCRALKPLRPSRAEVERVMGELKQHKHKMAGKLKLDDLFSYMETPVNPAPKPGLFKQA